MKKDLLQAINYGKKILSLAFTFIISSSIIIINKVNAHPGKEHDPICIPPEKRTTIEKIL